MAINQRKDGKFTVTCRDENGASLFAVRDTMAEAEGFFILNARASSCRVVPTMSFAGLCVWHRLEREREGVVTADAIYSNCLHAVAHFGDVRIGDVHLGHLSRARAAMIKNGMSNATANSIFNRVRTLYHYAHCARRIATNQVSPEKGQAFGALAARRHAAGVKRRPVKTPDETSLALLYKLAPPHLRVVINLIEDWVRFSELIVLADDCIDLELGSVLVKRAVSYEGIVDYPPEKWRMLLLSPKSVTAIRRFRFEMAAVSAQPSQGRQGMLFPFALKDKCLGAFAHLQAVRGEFAPELVYNRTVVRAIASGMSSYQISRRAGRAPVSITARFHVAFRRRAARALLVPMNVNLARLLA